MKMKGISKLWVFLAGLIFSFIGMYLGFNLWESKGNGDVTRIKDAIEAQSKDNETIAVFKDEDRNLEFYDVGRFISDSHEWYNKTLGWGGIHSVDWQEQQSKAEEILDSLSMIRTENSDLQSDLQTIHSYETKVESGQKDKDYLKTLHRFFHDLDIEYNGYSQTNDYYDVTEFKRKVSED